MRRACTRIQRIAPTIALVLICELAQAQTVSAIELQRCAAIERGVERLDCFDALARRLGAGDQPPAAPPLEGTPSGAAPVVSGVDAFGSELLEDTGIEVPDEIRSRLVGEFTGWRGNTEFRLENGQVWRQAEEGRMSFSADGPMVTIRRGAFNSYRLSVDGLNSTVRVRRVE